MSLRINFGSFGPYYGKRQPEWVKNLLDELTKDFAEEYLISVNEAKRHLQDFENRFDLKDFIELRKINVKVYWLNSNVSWGLYFTEDQKVEAELKYSKIQTSS